MKAKTSAEKFIVGIQKLVPVFQQTAAVVVRLPIFLAIEPFAWIGGAQVVAYVSS